MTTLIATDTEAAALRDGRQTLLVIPMEPQPELVPNHAPFTNVGFDRVYWNGAIYVTSVLRRLAPYAPGDIVGVKEAWQIVDSQHSGRQRLYRASHPHDDDWQGPWRAATTMPLHAIRTRIRILTVEARLVGSITYRECLAAGTPSRTGGMGGQTVEACVSRRDAATVGAFAAEWHHRHPDRPFETSWAWFYTVRIEK